MNHEARKMLLIYVDETDRHGDTSLYEAIVRVLHRHHIAGATVQMGVMGYGSHSYVHRRRLFGISDDKPVSIMSVDSEEKLRAVLPEIQGMMREGLMVLLDVEFVPVGIEVERR